MIGMFNLPKGERLIMLLLVVLPLFDTITSNINATTVTAIITMPKAMKVKFSRNFEEGR